jgi:hypothetical protein
MPSAHTASLVVNGQINGTLPPAPTNPQVTQLRSQIAAFITDADKKLTTGPSGPIRLIEVTSYLQLPIILEKLQNSQESIRLTFPPPAGGQPEIVKEQEAIHNLISSRHSKTLGDLVTEFKSLLGQSYAFKGHQQADVQSALNILDNLVHLNDKNTAQLQVNHIIDLSTVARSARKPLVEHLVTGVAKGPASGGYIVQADPSSEKDARLIARRLDYSLTRNPKASSHIDLVQVWIGPKVDWDRNTPPPSMPSFNELSLEELRRRLRNNQAILPVQPAPNPPPTNQPAPNTGNGWMRSIGNAVGYFTSGRYLYRP